MYIEVCYAVHMVRRTTIEIDEQLLSRARSALGAPTIRATVEEALRRVAAEAEDETDARAERQRAYFEGLPSHADMDVLMSEEMWR